MVNTDIGDIKKKRKRFYVSENQTPLKFLSQAILLNAEAADQILSYLHFSQTTWLVDDGKCASVELKINTVRTKALEIVHLIQGYFTTGDLSTYQEITGNALTKHHCDAAFIIPYFLCSLVRSEPLRLATFDCWLLCFARFICITWALTCDVTSKISNSCVTCQSVSPLLRNNEKYVLKDPETSKLQGWILLLRT